jgi:DNA-binding transcriptional MerR regulator
MSNVTHLPQQHGLTASEVLEQIPGLTYRQLDFWSRSGRIQPLPGKSGSGHYHRYTPQQVAIISRMYRLVNLGFTLDAAHQIATDRPTAERVLRGVSTIVIEHTFSEDDSA